MGPDITSFSTPKLQEGHANSSISHLQTLLCFPEAAWGSLLGKLRQGGRRGEVACGVGSGGRQHPAPRWEGGGRDLRWGRGMCLLGQEIVGLGERGTRLLRKQAEAERQRGRAQEGGSGGRNAGYVPAPGRCAGPAAGPAAWPCQSCSSALGAPFPLHRQAWSRVAAQEVRAAPLLVLAWACLSFPSLKNHPAHQPHAVVSTIPGVPGQA